MTKLRPKPAFEVKKKTWKDLDDLLIANFTSTPQDSPQAFIIHNDYEMSVDEIVSEAESQGYTVTVEDQYIKFK